MQSRDDFDTQKVCLLAFYAQDCKDLFETSIKMKTEIVRNITQKSKINYRLKVNFN